jgi:hypothetical protein
MKTMNKYIFLASVVLGSSLSFSSADGKVDSCRIYQDGSLRIYFDTSRWGENPNCGNYFNFPVGAFSEQAHNSIIAACFTAKAGNRNIRIDYETCDGGEMTYSDMTTVQLR